MGTVRRPAVSINNRNYYASNIVWLILHRTLTELVLHKCNNVMCLNPDHLYEGSQQQNILQSYADGRIPWQLLKAEEIRLAL